MTRDKPIDIQTKNVLPGDLLQIAISTPLWDDDPVFGGVHLCWLIPGDVALALRIPIELSESLSDGQVWCEIIVVSRGQVGKIITRFDEVWSKVE